ncbi:hypothetical protein BN1723_013362 [Verticillium longisporum]|uniref:Uncharacterized protein n=1 Tax=Verticillium longisporum TaxID=100787 RepID=A0A0G4LRV4_VERLO|nr:hypothetical protein BN1723_013362 [Verticillium longisporum]
MPPLSAASASPRHLSPTLGTDCPTDPVFGLLQRSTKEGLPRPAEIDIDTSDGRMTSIATTKNIAS